MLTDATEMELGAAIAGRARPTPAPTPGTEPFIGASDRFGARIDGLVGCRLREEDSLPTMGSNTGAESAPEPVTR